jgi:hypothetical protein
MEHLDPGIGQRTLRTGHRLVEPARPLGPAGDQQRRAVGVEAEGTSRLLP